MTLRAVKVGGCYVYSTSSETPDLVLDFVVDDLHFVVFHGQLWAVRSLGAGDKCLIFDGSELLKGESGR
jgi:hypothetical protein